MSFFSYGTNGQPIGVMGGWLPGSMDLTRYIEFNASPVAGNDLNISTISFNYGDNTNTTDFNILKSQLYYSINGTNWIQLGGTLNYLNTSVTAFSATIPGGATVPNGQTFSLRIYPYSTTGSMAGIPSFAFHNSVQICGTSSPASTVVPATICGAKFNDLNGNANLDSGEPRLPGWVIQLSYNQANGLVVLKDTTDANGNYCFNNLQPGITYIVSEVNQPGWVQTYPAAPYNTYTVTAATGQDYTMFFGNKADESSTNCVTPPLGMVAWWPLDEISGTTSTDLAGFNNVGTQSNNPTTVPAKVLGGLQFDGATNYIEVPDQTDLNFFIHDFSFDAWIKTTQRSGAGDMVDKLNAAYKGYSFFLHDGYLSLQMADGNFTTYVSPVFVADGNWHHIAITVSRSSTTGIIFYIDGVATQYGNPTVRSGSLDNKGPLRIGGQSYSTNYQFNGILDEIELFNRVITPEEVNSIFKAGSAGKCKLTTSIYDINQTTVKSDLIQCFPNPFSSSTRVQYNVPKSDFVRIVVSDLFGREIYVLINEKKNEGQYELTFDAKSLNSGVYLYSINIGGLTQSKKMILMK